MTLLAKSRLGPYEVVGLLGAGGMGEVYRALDPRLGREVAIKILPEEVAADPQRLVYFEREARAVAALNHPNILTIYDVGTHDGTPYVITELLEGETLRELVSRRSPTVPQVLGYMLQAARGLEAAHAKGIVHRDLKPENLFLTTDGRVKVLDFGLAKLVRREEDVGSDVSTALRSTAAGQVAGTVLYMSPEQARGHAVDARSDVFSFGVVLYEHLAGRHPFRKDSVAATLTAIVEETPPGLESLSRGVLPAVGRVVRRCMEKVKGERYASGHDVAVALEAILAAPSGAAALREVEERSPYPGLSSFTEKDAAHFFGREKEVAELWGRIPNRKLLAVIGPSGAGKTSFVRAGILARRPEGWAAIVAVPGAQPFRGLGRALGPEFVGDAEALGQLAGFEEPDTAVALVSRWRERSPEALVVLDQLEELFTLNAPEVQERFAALIGRLTHEADVHVLLSLRDDFLIRCCEQPALAPVLRELTVLLSLTGADLRRALEEPAGKRGYRFEDDALVDEMVQAVEGARAALPLLAFAVSRLWEKRDRETRVLARAAYEEVGGVAGALAQHAEQTLERIGSDRQEVVREIFRNLATSQGTRASADREELLSVFPERKPAEEVLSALVDARLLTSYEVPEDLRHPERDGTGRSRIEIAHESLLRAWPRLVRWQTQDEDGALLRDQLKQAAHLWDEKGRTSDLLWTGAAYQELELWQQRYPGKLTALEEDFSAALAERARRQKRFRRLVASSIVAAAALVAVVTSGLWWRAERAREQATAEALRAEASQLLALAQNRLEEDPTEALALTTASLRLADGSEARAFAVRALWEGPPARELDSGNDSIAADLAFSPDGAWLSKAGWDAEVRIWGEDGRGPVRLPGHELFPANKAEWTSNGFLVTGPNSLIAESEARWAHVWAFPEGKRVRTIDFGEDTWWHIGREHLFAETIEKGPPPKPELTLLRSWRLPDGEPEVWGRIRGDAEFSFFEPGGRAWLYTRGRGVYRRPLPVTEGRPDELLFAQGRNVRPLWYFPTHKDRVFFRDGESGEIQIWSFAKAPPKRVATIPKPEAAEELRSLLPEGSGRWVFDRRTWTNRQVRLWSAASLPGARPLVLKRSGSWNIGGLSYLPAFHPKGDWVVVPTHATSHLTFWSLRKVYPLVVDGYESSVNRPLGFSGDGRWLATDWQGQGESLRGIRLWPLPGSGAPGIRTLPLPPRAFATRMAFAPRDRFLFGVMGNRARVVPLDGSAARELENPNPYREYPGASVSPSGRWVATASYRGKGATALALWDGETGERRLFALPEVPSTPEGFEGGVNSVHFVDETTLYTAGVAGVLRWDLEAGTHETVFAAEPGAEVKMEVSADSRTALARWHRLGAAQQTCEGLEVLRPTAQTRELLTDFGECPGAFALDPTGTVVATGDFDGVVRVGRLAAGKPHLLFGHTGAVDSVAISPDLRWVASSGEDNTLRLWPMPDLDKPPLHTLAHDELIAKLESLTNLHAVRDPDSSTGWMIELGPFPGWREVPEW